jgi:hypothetical protein
MEGRDKSHCRIFRIIGIGTKVPIPDLLDAHGDFLLNNATLPWRNPMNTTSAR